MRPHSMSTARIGVRPHVFYTDWSDRGGDGDGHDDDSATDDGVRLLSSFSSGL